MIGSSRRRPPFLADRNSQSIRIEILRDARTKDFFWFLNADDLGLHHPTMERVQIDDPEAGPATPGWSPGWVIRGGRSDVGRVESQRGSLGGKFRPTR